MKRTLPAAIGIVGALAMTGCGTDDNSAGSRTTGGGDCVRATVNAAGSTAQANAMSEWIKGYQQSCPGANVNYNADGSGAGIQAFTGGQVAFAGSDSALTAREHGPADRRCGTGKALDLPMVGGPIAVVYNLRGVDDLRLSPATIAGIFAGTIRAWNDPAIARDNPGARLPPVPVRPLHRSDDSGTTDNFTKFLRATAPGVWRFDGGKSWPAAARGQGLKSSAGVATGIGQSEGTIGYVELSFATAGRLRTAKVANGSGTFTALTPDTAAKAIGGARVVGQGGDLALAIDYKTPEGYPIVLVSYEIVCAKGLPGEQARFVRSFLSYTSSPRGQSVLSTLGYAPLPKSVLVRVQSVVRGLS